MAIDVPPIIPCYQQVLAIVGSEIMSNQININHPIFGWTVPSLSNKNHIRWFLEFPGFITLLPHIRPLFMEMEVSNPCGYPQIIQVIR